MFNIVIERDSLVTALSYLAPTVGTNATNVGDDCILMQTLGNSTTVQMYTTNTVEFTEVELTISGGGATVDVAPPINFKRFRSVIESIPEGDQVTITAGPNEVALSFDMKSNPITITGSLSGMLPLPKMNKQDVYTIPRNFLESVLSRVPKMIDDDPNAPIFNCMRIATDNYDVEVTALDAGTKRVYCETLSGTNMNQPGSVLVEARKLSKSIKLFAEYDDVDFIVDNSIIRVSGNISSANSKYSTSVIDSVSYYCSKLSGNYPSNLRKSFDPMPTEWLHLHCEELGQVLSRIMAINDVDDSIVFNVKNEEVSMNKTTQYGKINEEVESEKKYSKSFAARFSANHLIKFLKMMPHDCTNIMFAPLPNHASQFFVLKPENVGNFMFMVPCLANQNSAGNTP